MNPTSISSCQYGSSRKEGEPRGTRRDLLTTLATPLLPRFERPHPQWRSDQKEESLPIIERPNEPIRRDVIRYGNTYYLVGKDKVHPMSHTEFEEHRYKSRFDEKRRRVFVNQGLELLDLPRGKPRDRKPFFDLYTGDVKFPVDVLNLLVSGSMTNGGIIHRPIPFIRLWPTIQEGLGELGWMPEHTLYFTWGKKELKEFSAQDTVKDPVELEQDVVEYMDNLEETCPYTQINLVGHSYGAVIGDMIVRRYPHMINAWVPISGPARGLDRKGSVRIPPFGIPLSREFAADFFRFFLHLAGIDERMSSNLFYLFDDKEYQKEVDESAARFVGMGRTLIDLTSVDDLIVPVESTIRRGKANELNGRRIPSAWKLLLERPKHPIDALIRHHWVFLDHPISVGLIKEAFGENRAAA